MFASVEYLAEHLQEVPVHVIPCLGLNLDGVPRAAQPGGVSKRELIGADWERTYNCRNEMDSSLPLSGTKPPRGWE